MLPPIDDAVLKDNPNFAILYSKLTKVTLNPDASTKQPPAEAKRREAIKKDLNSHRLIAAKQHLLTRALSTASPPDTKPSRSSKQTQQRQQEPLSEEVCDLLLILPALLNTEKPLSSKTLALLLSSPPLSNLDALVPSLTPLISSTIHTSALSLTRITHPTTNPSYLHRHVTSLPNHVSALLTKQEELHASLATARMKTLASLITLLSSHSRVLTALIRTLEVKHGIIARNMELRAADAALQAQKTELDAERKLDLIKKEIYTPEAVQALINYGLHLRDAKSRTKERIRGLKAELGEYGVGVPGGEEKEKKMREMARVYHQMTRQMKDTRGDLDRLEGS